MEGRKWSLMRAQVPDLVLLDWQMQGLDEFRFVAPSGPDPVLFIIIVTWGPTGESRALAAGCERLPHEAVCD